MSSMADEPTSVTHDSIKYDRMADGTLAAWIHPTPDTGLLRRLADVLVADLGGKMGKRLDGVDQVYWDFVVDRVKLTLHSEHYLGIAVLANSRQADAEATLRRVAEKLCSSVSDAERGG